MTLAVVSHDAGGAEVLSSYVRRLGLRPFLVLEGPARSVFARKLGPVANLTLPEAIERCSAVLCGTSWQSNLEFDAIGFARTHAKHCSAFLDHWVNYGERFVRDGVTRRPDEIWVGDDSALQLARATFAGVPIRLVDNPYFADIREELAQLALVRSRTGAPLSVLYVCEPVREHAVLRFGNPRHFGYTEEEALRYFLDNIAALGAPVELVRIRPHPSEAGDKYAWAPREYSLPIELGSGCTLLDDIASCDVVVGCESMAIVVGMLAGKRVVSCIPPGGRHCGLPQPQIEHLQALLKTGS